MEKEIERIIEEKIAGLKREDLLRRPFVAFSSAHDPAYRDLKTIIGEWHLTPIEILPDAQSVISYFVPFTKPVTRQPKKFDTSAPLWAEAYLAINSYFDTINDTLVDFLRENGYSASPIPATHNFDPETIRCNWSHRSAAAIAGIGSFGANRMLITGKGSSGRFCTVITSAKLAAQTDKASQRCLYLINGTCGKCFEICPVGALAPDGFDKFSCQAVTIGNKEAHKGDGIRGRADVCGKCISVCPVGFIE